MPANKKYLSTPWQRAHKIIAGILFGYIVDTLLHMALAKLFIDKSTMVMTTVYSFWLVWIGCMLSAFLLKRTALIWFIYLIISGVSLYILMAVK